jgi:predicted RND superfamily exporter protein
LDSKAQRKTAANIADILIDKRFHFMALVILVTAILALFVPNLTVDNSIKAFVPPDAEESIRYDKFLEIFGNEAFILVVITNKEPATRPGSLQRLAEITSSFSRLDGVVKVVSLTNLKIFEERKGLFGTYPLVSDKSGEPRIDGTTSLKEIRKALPVTDLLLSQDQKSLGVVLEVDPERQFDAAYVAQLRASMEEVLDKTLPSDSRYLMVGIPVVSEAIQKYNVQTMLIFVSIAGLIGLVVSSYIFKGIRVSLVFMTVSTLGFIWLLGLMAIVGIAFNSITGLSFGLVMILTVASSIHIATHFYEASSRIADRAEAARHAVRLVGRPCLMCAVTTAVGFASLTLGTCPAARDLGKVMTSGVLISFMLVMVFAPAILIVSKPIKPRTLARMYRDVVSLAFEKLEGFVFSHHRFCLVAGILITVLMLAGTYRIQTDTHLFHLLSASTQEIQDFRRVEEQLSPFQNLELILQGDTGVFKKSDTWNMVIDLERQLNDMPEIEGTDSIVGLFCYLGRVLSGPSGDEQGVLARPGMVKELMTVASFSEDGRTAMRRYLDDTAGILRLSLRIRNFSPIPLGETIDKVIATSNSVAKGVATATVTGFLEVYATHAASLLRSQGLSLIAALSVITILMILQFRSVVLGLLSLVPNLVPLAVIFGCMGWFGISLDPGTIIVATISIGLSVDDTIHYLTQLKRELKAAGAGADIEACLRLAYQKTGRALISTSAILFLSFLALLLSPFRPVGLFGLLASLAIMAALLADLAFMPSVMLYVPGIRRLVEREMTA